MHLFILLVFYCVYFSSYISSITPTLFCHAERVRHELIDRYWYVIISQRGPLRTCHIVNEKKDGETGGRLGVLQLSWCWHHHRRLFVRYPFWAFTNTPTYLQTCAHTRAHMNTHICTHLSLPLGSPEIPFRPITAAVVLKSPPDETLSYICTSSIEKWGMVILVWR